MIHRDEVNSGERWKKGEGKKDASASPHLPRCPINKTCSVSGKIKDIVTEISHLRAGVVSSSPGCARCVFAVHTNPFHFYLMSFSPPLFLNPPSKDEDHY